VGGSHVNDVLNIFSWLSKTIAYKKAQLSLTNPRDAWLLYSGSAEHCKLQQESRAVAREPCDATAVVFGLKFADNIHHKFKSSQASKARLQSSKRTCAKQNLTQNGHSGSFAVTCFGVSGKLEILICWPYLLRFRRCSVYERSAVFRGFQIL